MTNSYIDKVIASVNRCKSPRELDTILSHQKSALQAIGATASIEDVSNLNNAIRRKKKELGIE